VLWLRRAVGADAQMQLNDSNLNIAKFQMHPTLFEGIAQPGN